MLSGIDRKSANADNLDRMSAINLEAMIADLVKAQKANAILLSNVIAEAANRSREIDLKMQESELKMQESDRKLKEAREEAEVKRRESKEEAERKLRESKDEVERKYRESRQETDRQIKEFFAKSGYDVGRMVEAIVEPGCVRLFRERGIDVCYTMRRVKAVIPGREMEIDILLLNGAELVAVEVKSMMNGSDINKWIKKLGQFREFFPQYRNHKIYGAVASLEFGGNADRFAHKKGLFVLRWADDLMIIANPVSFQGKSF
jgi:hypothetical protein